MKKVRMAQLVGKIVREGAEILIVYRILGKYYPATDFNCQQIEAYMHTGDEIYLLNLEHEMEV